MTPEQLAALPVGTRLSFDLAVVDGDEIILADQNTRYDYGTITRAGAIVQVDWERPAELQDILPSASIIDTKSHAWMLFILDLAVVPQVQPDAG